MLQGTIQKRRKNLEIVKENQEGKHTLQLFFSFFLVVPKSKFGLMFFTELPVQTQTLDHPCLTTGSRDIKQDSSVVFPILFLSIPLSLHC